MSDARAGCLRGRLFLLARDDEGGVEQGPVVLRRGRFVLAVVLLGFSKQIGQRREVHPESASGQPRHDLLQEPAVAVRVTKGCERTIGAALWIPTRYRPLLIRREMEYAADIDASADQLLARRFDVRDDQPRSCAHPARTA